MKAGFAALFFVIFLWSCEKSTGIGPALVDPTLNTLLVERYVTGRASTDIFSINEDGMNAFRLTTVGDETKTFP
ncbi:MAG: hypothetical protein EOO10_21840, partial [Chitinophagaceae bacterium]